MKKTKFGVAMILATILVFAFSITALAWNQPTVTANCAPDSNHYSFTIVLTGSESNYNIDWSWNSSFSGATTVNSTTNPSPYTLVVPRGGTTLYVRWSSDNGSYNSATANGTLCHKSHTVTWDTHANCDGWIATYSIDGGGKVVYDSGTWSNPYVNETANPKAFTVPEISGDTYDHPNSPSVTIYESKDCKAPVFKPTGNVLWSVTKIHRDPMLCYVWIQDGSQPSDAVISKYCGALWPAGSWNHPHDYIEGYLDGVYGFKDGWTGLFLTPDELPKTDIWW